MRSTIQPKRLAPFVWLLPLLLLSAASTEDPRQWVELATAAMEQARATGDVAWYARAEAAVTSLLARDPTSLEGLRLQAWVLGGQHRFEAAARAAREALAQAPADAMSHGVLGDALVELGDYDGAERAFDRMMELRPGTAAYARVAYLRELRGDPDGALEALRLAARSASPNAPLAAAWIHMQLGELHFGRGELDPAASEYERSLALLPSSGAATSGLARVRGAQGRLDEAERLYAEAVRLLPAPAILARYGDLLAHLGRRAEADRQWALVRLTSSLSPGAGGLHEREVALFLADHGLDVAAALASAEAQLRTRRDIYGFDAVAWCALAAGDVARAREAMPQALRLGTRDALLHYHAGMIALAAGEAEEARKALRRALAINPYFELEGAARARRALASLESAG